MIAHELPDWDCEEQLLQQLLRGQQKLKQSIAQLNAEMRIRFANFDFNTSVLAANARLNSRQKVHWLRNRQGRLPPQQQLSVGTLRWRALAAVVDPLLEHYGLPLEGTIRVKRQRLLNHLGIYA
eukprot:GHUV01008366.1.p1 GENE.GHUV01008366.1~~GHUV01008366.1.p1  ORF type:complete len:124 (+),score=32.63 GHUV01008366.1:675-1046(+)